MDTHSATRTFTAQWYHASLGLPNGVRRSRSFPCRRLPTQGRRGGFRFSMNSVVSRAGSMKRVQIGRDFEQQVPTPQRTWRPSRAESTSASELPAASKCRMSAVSVHRQRDLVCRRAWREDRLRHQLRERKPDQLFQARHHLPEHQRHCVRLPAGASGCTRSSRARRPISVIHELQPGVRSSRPGSRGRHSIPDVRLQLVHPGQLAPQ